MCSLNENDQKNVNENCVQHMSTNDWTAAANGARSDDPIYKACLEDAKDSKSVGKKSNLIL